MCLSRASGSECELNAYVAAALGHRRALDQLEQLLESPNAADYLDTAALRIALATVGCTEDDIEVLTNALSGLGVLGRTRSGWSLNHVALQETVGYRSGVRDALVAWAGPDSPATLLVAPPADASVALTAVVRQHASDLRFAVLDLIASAKSELLLASPFWDEETVEDLKGPLQGRIDAGVQVTLLTRDARARPIGRLRQSLLFRTGQLRSYEWFSIGAGPSVLQASTFHLKAIIQDRGLGAYLGSANFTLASMRSRMELGVRLEGAVAADLSALLYASLGEAREVT